MMRIWEFVAACTILEITPGPNMSYLIALTISHGWVAAFRAVFGVATGLLLVGCLAALGLAEFINSYPLIEKYLRWGGVLFMLWLAYDSWSNAPVQQEQQRLNTYWRGLTTNLLNPKLIVFYLAMLPDFIDETRGNILQQNLQLVLLYTLIATTIHLLLITFSVQLKPIVDKSHQSMSIGKIMAILLFGVACWMVWDS